MPWQVFYKMYRPPSPPSSDISYTVKPEFPKYLLQISLKPRPPDSVLKLDSLVPRDIKIHPCNVKMWNAAPVTWKIQILRPNSPLSTLHATSGSQNQKSQKEETIAKNTTQKNHIYYMNFWYTKFTLVTALCDVGVTKPGEPLDAFFAARFPFTFVG